MVDVSWWFIPPQESRELTVSSPQWLKWINLTYPTSNRGYYLLSIIYVYKWDERATPSPENWLKPSLSIQNHKNRFNTQRRDSFNYKKVSWDNITISPITGTKKNGERTSMVPRPLKNRLRESHIHGVWHRNFRVSWSVSLLEHLLLAGWWF